VAIEAHRSAVLILGAALLAPSALDAQSAYRYRDASGSWVYTDRKPDGAGSQPQPVTLAAEKKPPRILIERLIEQDQVEMRAINECACVVEFQLHLGPANAAATPQSVFHAVLEPHSERALFRGARGEAQTYQYRAVLGQPGARHAPEGPYRAPFALGASYLISQAHPRHTTHTTPDSFYAVDIALPEGTPVYAARDGTVINLEYANFRGAPTPVFIDSANQVSILHADGTIAVYGHLSWNSVRVEPGQKVRRGEYLADSGNTGFTSGPHLHFAVIRNAGMKAESVPLEFEGLGGVAVTPAPGAMLTAY